MSLLTSFSDTNKVVTTGLRVAYSSTQTNFGNADNRNLWYWTISRNATKSYKYVGMTEAAAKSCLAAMREEYTREYARWNVEVYENSSGVPVDYIHQLYNYECTSDIAMTRDGDSDMWDVEISVNETDTTIARGAQTSLAALRSLFSFATSRNYGGEYEVPSLYLHDLTFSTGTNVISGYLDFCDLEYSADDLDIVYYDTTWTYADPVVTATATPGRYAFSNTYLPSIGACPFKAIFTVGSTTITSNQLIPTEVA